MWSSSHGKEMSAHTLLTAQSRMPVCFADAKTLWRRGSKEQPTGLLRQYFLRSTDLSLERRGNHRDHRCDKQPTTGRPWLAQSR